MITKAIKPPADIKTVRPTSFKFLDAEAGTFEAVFATLDVVDADEDVILPGSIGRQEVVVSQYNHGSWDTGAKALPIGVGEIREEGDEAIVAGAFDMSDPDAVKTRNKIKYLVDHGRQQEWSFALPETEYSYGERDGRPVRLLSKILVPEVSPVLMGAGVNTRVLSIKRAGEAENKAAVASHSTAIATGSWDGPANEKRVRTGEAAPYYRKIYAWQDPDAEVGTKAAWRFIHHEIAGDGDPGAANVRACQTGIGVLNGARGGTTIPEGDRSGVYRHLSRHLRDADVEPPELRAQIPPAESMKLTEQIESVLGAVEGLRSRLSDIAQKREVKGKMPIDEAKQETIAELAKSLEETAREVAALLETEADREDVLREYLRY